MVRAVTRATALLLLVLLAPAASAEESEVLVRDIRIEGLGRTHESVVLRELPFRTGESVTTAQLEEGMQRLRNLGLFDTAEYSWDEGVLHVAVTERWTILPAFKLSRGGGVSQLVVAAYDINVAGRYLELGAQYERLGEANSFVLWHRNPRLFDRRLWLGLDVWSVRRPRVLHDEDGAIDGGFLLERFMAVAALERENESRTVRAGVRLRAFADDFSSRYLPAEAVQGQGALPPAQTVFTAGASLALGTVESDSYLQSGGELRLEVDAAPPVGFNDNHFVDATLQWLQFVRAGKRSLLAARFLAGGITTAAPQHLHYAGGLDRVRGFVDSRFRGQLFAVANLEARVPSLHLDWFVLQHVVFTDALVIAGQDTGSSVAASAGAGVRFIFPRVYRLILRLDYAPFTLGDGQSALSFGIQQLF